MSRCNRFGPCLLATLVVVLVSIGCGGGGGGGTTGVADATATSLIPALITIAGGQTFRGLYAAIGDSSVSTMWVKKPTGEQIPATRTTTRDRYNRLTVTLMDNTLPVGQYVMEYILGGETQQYSSPRDLEWTSFTGFDGARPPDPDPRPENGTIYLQWPDIAGGRAQYRLQVFNFETGYLREEIEIRSSQTYALYLEPALRGVRVELRLLADINDGGATRARAEYRYRPEQFFR